MPFSSANYLKLLAACLVGYVLMGRGFAYVGLPPIFIGEIILGLGLIALIWSGQTRRLFDHWLGWLLAAFMLWGAARTLPYLKTYGVNALRDAVIWGYAFFAFIVAALLVAQPRRLAMLVRWYGVFVLPLLILAPVTWIVGSDLLFTVPNWPWADVPMIHVKGGDLCVHVAGAFAFVAIVRRGRAGLAVLLLIGLNMLLNAGRGALLTFLVGITLIVILRPRMFLLKMAAVLLVPLLFLYVSGLKIQFSANSGRDISFKQLTASLGSIVGESDSGRLESTKEWRLDWWGTIVGYTFRGKYFWTGKGFGVNLAADDEWKPNLYSVYKDEALRSPHNGHFTILARAGVPGLALWLAVHGAWLGGMARCYFRSRRMGDQRWADFFLFLSIYWIGFHINAAFDVFLEGPMGGIWMWVVYGVGMGAMWIYHKCPQALYEGEGAISTHAPRSRAWQSAPVPVPAT